MVFDSSFLVLSDLQVFDNDIGRLVRRHVSVNYFLYLRIGLSLVILWLFLLHLILADQVLVACGPLELFIQD